MEAGLSKNAIINELAKSPHGDFKEYLTVGRRAAIEEPEFFAHLIAWNRTRGEIRDAKAALPIVALTAPEIDRELRDNALAHLAFLDPRSLDRAWTFAHSLKLRASVDRNLNNVVARYLHKLEDNYSKWQRVAIQHRSVLTHLYANARVKPQRAVFGEILFQRKYPENSTFEILTRLKDMQPLVMAAEIMGRGIPFQIAIEAVGEKRKDPDVLLALIERMTPSQLVGNMRRLDKLGVRTIPALRAAIEEALGKASKSKKNLFKASVAVGDTEGTRGGDDIVEDDALKDKLRKLQERQIEALKATDGVDGDVLILADRSPSMKQAIEVARLVAGTLAKMVKGRVHLVFFDGEVARTLDATGKTYEEILADTKHVTPGGRGTSVCVGLNWALTNDFHYDLIVIVSDAQENSPPSFVSQYAACSKKWNKEVPVYLYRCKTLQHAGLDVDLAASTARAGIKLQEFDLRELVDYYSLPNMIKTMRVNQYSLVGEIMAVPLLSVEMVLPRKEEVAC